MAVDFISLEYISISKILSLPDHMAGRRITRRCEKSPITPMGR